MKLKVLYWVVGLPAGIILYSYDDILWGPAPIALTNRWLGWPAGLIFLGFVYFIVSFIACFLILSHYEKLDVKTNQQKWIKEKSKKRKSFAYTLLFQSKWIGLAISCFALGAILTAIPVGRFKLFPGVRKSLMAVVMSFLFVFLFLGFYGGLFTALLEFGIWTAIALAAVSVICMKLGYVLISNNCEFVRKK